MDGTTPRMSDERLGVIRALAERYRALAPVYETIGGGDDHARVAELVVEVDRLRAIEAAASALVAVADSRNPDPLSARWWSEEQEAELEAANHALRSALEEPRP